MPMAATMYLILEWPPILRQQYCLNISWLSLTNTESETSRLVYQFSDQLQPEVQDRSQVSGIEPPGQLKTYWSGGNCEGEEGKNAKQIEDNHLQLFSCQV